MMKVIQDILMNPNTQDINYIVVIISYGLLYTIYNVRSNALYG